MEIWKDIPGFEGLYQASNYGKIRSIERVAKKEYRGNRIVKPREMEGTFNEDGYLKVHLSNKERGINKVFFKHRLVALTFINNPNEYECVNHIDGNKTNNNVNNLEWCNNLYNQQHAWKNKLHRPTKVKGKKVKQYDLNGNFIKQYESISEAGRETNISIGNICTVLKNKRNKAGGYKWTY